MRKYDAKGMRLPTRRNLYLIAFGDGFVKIGITIDVSRRMREHRIKSRVQPTVHQVINLPYTCARCFEYTMGYMSEYFFPESLPTLQDNFEKISTIAGELECKYSHKKGGYGKIKKMCGHVKIVKNSHALFMGW